jgi:hypothetical protein
MAAATKPSSTVSPATRAGPSMMSRTRSSGSGLSENSSKLRFRHFLEAIQVIGAQRHDSDERQVLVEQGVQHRQELLGLGRLGGAEQLLGLIDRYENLRLVRTLGFAQIACQLR